VIDNIRKVMRGEKGFTLVEMMVVLIIIAVLIALGIRAYIGYIGNSKLTKAEADITTVQAALDSYYSSNSQYPVTQVELTSAGVSSYEVLYSLTWGPGQGPGGATPPYQAVLASSTYRVFMVNKVSGESVEGTGSGGTSQPAIGTYAT